MSDFLTQFLADEGPVARVIKHKGQEGTVYFRRISAGERAQLLKGQRVHSAGKESTVEIDLGENQQTKLMLVMFSLCDASGARVFASIDAVRKVDALKAATLYDLAADVNAAAEAADAGKA